MRPILRSVAAHEVGHAAARLVLDEILHIPGPRVKSITIKPGDGYLGLTIIDRQAPLMLPRHGIEETNRWWRKQNRLDMIEVLAGPIAEARWKCSEAALYISWSGQIGTEYRDFDDDMASVIRSAERDRASMPGFLALPDSFTSDVIDEAKRITLHLVCREWASIRKAAAILRDEETMGGERFAQVWAEVRTVPARRERLDGVWKRAFAEWVRDFMERAVPEGAGDFLHPCCIVPYGIGAAAPAAFTHEDRAHAG